MDKTSRECIEWLPGFFREPEWRWIRAGHLAAKRRRLDSRIDDDWVACALRLRRGHGRWPASEKLKCSAIAAACVLWSGEPLFRSRVEAHLLTSASFARIATICGLDPPVIEAYHAVFFEVRPKAKATDWLLSRAIGWWKATTPNLGQVWKYLAVAGGELVLEVAIAVTAGMPLPVSLRETFANPVIDEARLRLRVQLSIFAMTANTPQQWKAIAAIRKRLRTLEAVHLDRPIDDERFAAMEAFLAIGADRHVEAASVKVHAVVERVQVLEADVVNVPVDHPESIHVSWRAYDAEDADAGDRIGVDEERCRVFVSTD